jgi:hypothetical protein
LGPIVVLGIVFVLFFTKYTTPTLARYITDQIDSNLMLASDLGLDACENRFNYLLELRLESDLAVNEALKREAIEEIKTISSRFHRVHMVVIDGSLKVVGSSQPLDQTTMTAFDLPHRTETVAPNRLWGRPLRLHHRFFPFWNWLIVSYIDQKDYLGPVQTVERSIYFGTLGVLGLLIVTLTVVFRKFVAVPLKQLIEGTHAVAEGRYHAASADHRIRCCRRRRIWFDAGPQH